MGKLGVREKSQIHILTRPTTPVGFGTGFIPAFFQDFDDPADGVPGGAGNFNARPSTTTNLFTTNNYLIQAQDAEDFDNGVPNASRNFAAVPATGGTGLTDAQVLAKIALRIF